MVNRSINQTHKVFREKASRFFIWWVGSIIAGVVTLAIDIAETLDIIDIAQVPAWAWTIFWIVLFAIGFVFAPMAVLHVVRIERDEKAVEVDNREYIAKILKELTDLRDEGVKIRNSGRAFLSESSVDNWVSQVNEWTKKTLGTLEKLSPAEAGIFRTLDQVSGPIPAGYHPFNSKHALHLAMLSQRTELLNQLIKRWNPK